MRYWRLLLGAILVITALWIILGEQISGISSDAVINARLSTLRTPISGQLEMPLRAFGEEFDAQETVATIKPWMDGETAPRATSMDLVAPVNGLLWEVLAGDGEFVERGQDIARFMVCGSALVTLSVSDNVYARLQVGQHAQFRLSGKSKVYDGTITRMAGAGAESIYSNLAVAPSIKHLERYDVAILVPALREQPALKCSVGQTGRVFFDVRPFDWLRQMMR